MKPLTIELFQNADDDKWVYRFRWDDLSGNKCERWLVRGRADRKAIADLLLTGGYGGIAALEKEAEFFYWLKAEMSAADRRPLGFCTLKTGWIKSGGIFLLPGESRPFDGREFVHAQGADPSDPRKIGCREGTLKKWKKGLAAPCAASPWVTLAIALGFSGPALRFAGLGEPPVIYFQGESSSGKTTLLRCMQSVFGSGSSSGLLNWNSTGTALDEASTSVNNLSLCIDEVGACGSDAAKRLQEFAFTNGSGRGRSRSKAVGGSLPQLTWMACAATTGERSLAEIFAADGVTLVQGVQHRLVEIEVPSVRSGGIFRKDPDADRLLSMVVRTLESNAAAAIQPWRRFLERDAVATEQKLRRLMARFDSRWPMNNGAGDAITVRVRKKFVFLAAVAELAAAADVAPWNAGKGAASIRKLWLRFERRRLRVGRGVSAVAKQCLELLDDGCCEDVVETSIAGQADSVIAISRNGVRSRGITEGQFKLLTTEAERFGALIKGRDGRSEAKVRMPGRRTRMYRFDLNWVKRVAAIKSKTSEQRRRARRGVTSSPEVRGSSAIKRRRTHKEE